MKIQEKYCDNAFTTTKTILLSCSTALVYGTVVRLELRLEHRFSFRCTMEIQAIY